MTIIFSIFYISQNICLTLNWSIAQTRSSWSLSPWIATASTPFRRRYSCTASTSRFFSAKISTCSHNKSHITIGQTHWEARCQHFLWVKTWTLSTEVSACLYMCIQKHLFLSFYSGHLGVLFNRPLKSEACWTSQCHVTGVVRAGSYLPVEGFSANIPVCVPPEPPASHIPQFAERSCLQRQLCQHLL